MINYSLQIWPKLLYFADMFGTNKNSKVLRTINKQTEKGYCNIATPRGNNLYLIIVHIET